MQRAIIDRFYALRWGATIAARRPIGEHVVIQAEALYVESDRPARGRDLLAPHQAQTVVQLALRLRV